MVKTFKNQYQDNANITLQISVHFTPCFRDKGHSWKTLVKEKTIIKNIEMKNIENQSDL